MVQDFPDWTRASLLQGQDAEGNPVTILLNADGQLIALLQGVFEGVATTIAVDAEGRIQVFVLDDESQWGDVIKVGNAELAARLGSPMTYDWRGKTLYFNTFEHGRGNLYKTLVGTGAAVSISPSYWISGGYSLKMVGASSSGGYARVQGIVSNNKAEQIGLQVCWSGYGTYDYVHFMLRVHDGTTRFFGGIKYDPGSYQLSYFNNVGEWTVLDNPHPTNYPFAFNYLKFVIDIDSSTYLRCLFGATEHDLAAIALYTDSGGFADAIEVDFRVESPLFYNYSILLDHLIVTIAEPQNRE